MREVTCHQFLAMLNTFLRKFERDWCDAHAEAPEDYPRRMLPEEWWRHLSNVVLPDLLLNAKDAREQVGGDGTSSAD